MTWKVIDNIIRTRCHESEFPSCFLNGSNDTVDNLKSIVEDFNDYFVGVGSTLASKIVVSDDKKDFFNNLIDSDTSSMFLCGKLNSWSLETRK